MTKSSNPAAAAPDSRVSQFVKVLAPWKELIAIAIFFATGAVWLAGYFATKKYADEIKCYTRESIAVARAETRMRSTGDELLQKSLRIDSLEGKARDSAATESDKIEMKRLQREVKDLGRDRETADTELKRAQKALEANDCSKEK